MTCQVLVWDGHASELNAAIWERITKQGKDLAVVIITENYQPKEIILWVTNSSSLPQ
jgi:hypothetical protein